MLELSIDKRKIEQNVFTTLMTILRAFGVTTHSSNIFLLKLNKNFFYSNILHNFVVLIKNCSLILWNVSSLIVVADTLCVQHRQSNGNVGRIGGLFRTKHLWFESDHIRF
jgi:hypothetical protein